MGSVRPARRFDALRALAWQSVPSRIAPDGGPPCTFAPLQRSIAAPPHRPADPKAAVGQCFLSWAFVPYDTCGTADPSPGGFRPPGVPRPGFETPIAASTTVPPASCDAERPWASPSKAFSSKRSGPLAKSPCPRGVHRVDSPRSPGERADAVAFRALIPLRARSAVPDPEGPGAPMPSWALSLQSSFLRPSQPLCVRGAIPSHALGGFDVRPRLRLRGLRYGRPDGPSRGRRLSWGSWPKHGRGTA